MSSLSPIFRFTFFSLFVFSRICLAEGLEIQDTETHYDLHSIAQFVPEPDNKPIEQFLELEKNDEFASRAATSSLFQGGTYWFSTTIHNHTQKTEWLLHINTNVMQRLDLLVLNKDEIIDKRVEFQKISHRARINPQGRAFPVQIPPDESRRIVVRLEAELYDDIMHILLMTDLEYERWSKILTLVLAGSSGLILGLIFYHLLMFLVVRDITYIWLSSACMLFLYQLGFYSGIWQEFFGHVLSNRYMDMFLMLIINLCVLNFGKSFLRFHKHTLFWSHCYSAGVAITVVTPLLYWLLSLEQFSLFVFLQTQLVFVLIVLSSIWSRWQGFRPATFLILGGLPFVVHNLLWNLAIIGFGSHEELTTMTTWAFVLTALIYIFMSLGLSERIQSLREEKLQAESASQSKTHFLAAASHDLRQPLHAMGLFISALSPHVINKTGQDLLLKLRIATESMSELFNSILDVSRLDADVIRPNVENFSIDRILRGVEPEFSAHARSKDLVFHIVHSQQFIRSDPLLLERALRNLISNAIRYTENGKVLVGCRRKGEVLLLQVYDTGSGISEGELEQAFGEFYQLQPKASHSREGIGLGLNIVKRTMQLLNHPVEVSSSPGKGSCFSIQLPIADASEINQPDTEKAEPGSVQDMVVMVIDNDEMILTAMKTMLCGWGCEVTTASNINEALAHLRLSAQAPDLLLVDLELGNGENGIQAISRIRWEHGHELAAAIITGNTASMLLKEDKPEDVQVMYKPVQPAQLRSLLLYTRQAPAGANR